MFLYIPHLQPLIFSSHIQAWALPYEEGTVTVFARSCCCNNTIHRQPQNSWRIRLERAASGKHAPTCPPILASDRGCYGIGAAWKHPMEKPAGQRGPAMDVEEEIDKKNMICGFTKISNFAHTPCIHLYIHLRTQLVQSIFVYVH